LTVPTDYIDLMTYLTKQAQSLKHFCPLTGSSYIQWSKQNLLGFFCFTAEQWQERERELCEDWVRESNYIATRGFLNHVTNLIMIST